MASYVYPLPFWRHDHEWYKQAVGGWQVSGITRISSGLPINVIQPHGFSITGNFVAGAVALLRDETASKRGHPTSSFSEIVVGST